MDRFKALLEKLQWSHVALAIAAAALFFYFTQDSSEIETREQGVSFAGVEIANLEKKVKEAKEFEHQFEAKKKKFSDLTGEVQRQQGALPRQFFLPDLLSDLLKEAKQLEIEVTMIRSDEKEVTQELYNSLGFNIEAKGTFLQFFIFVDRLAHMKRLLTLDLLSIEKDTSRPLVTLGGEEGAFANSRLTGGRAAYPGIRGSLRVLTYRYRTPSAAPPAIPKKRGGR
ncbi:MAG: type 4a pilus biogenesis protein PilO [Bacteriovoracia bacterium]